MRPLGSGSKSLIWRVAFVRSVDLTPTPYSDESKRSIRPRDSVSCVI